MFFIGTHGVSTSILAVCTEVKKHIMWKISEKLDSLMPNFNHHVWKTILSNSPSTMFRIVFCISFWFPKIPKLISGLNIYPFTLMYKPTEWRLLIYNYFIKNTKYGYGKNQSWMEICAKARLLRHLVHKEIKFQVIYIETKKLSGLENFNWGLETSLSRLNIKLYILLHMKTQILSWISFCVLKLTWTTVLLLALSSIFNP